MTTIDNNNIHPTAEKNAAYNKHHKIMNNLFTKYDLPKNEIEYMSYQKSGRSEILEWIYDNVSKESKIIELGCGYGLIQIRLFDYGFRNVYGIDISGKAVKFTKESLELLGGIDNCNICQADIKSLPFLNDSFDLVLMVGVASLAEQFNLSEIGAIIREIHRILKPGGILIGDFSLINSRMLRNLHRYLLKKDYKLTNIDKKFLVKTSKNLFDLEFLHSRRYVELVKMRFRRDNPSFTKRVVLNGIVACLKLLDIVGILKNIRIPYVVKFTKIYKEG